MAQNGQNPVESQAHANLPWVLHVIPNTHWDREWYMSFERYRLRLVKLMDRLLELLARDPSYRTFTLDGQFIPIQDYLELRPEREAEVAALVRAGRLLVGPWYTQPLETLAGGEALIRNLMRGIAESRRFGACLMISYIIDEFGHVSQLPQILRGFGIESVVAWRGVPAGRKSVFRWQSPDGSEVFFFHSNGGYGEATALPEALDDFTETVEGTAFPREGLRNRIRRLLELRTPRATTRQLLALNGIDHSFAQENLTGVLQRINALFPGVRAVHSDLAAFTEAVRDAHVREKIPYEILCGELYDDNEPVLEPIHSFRAELKIVNDRVEGLLVCRLEPLAALAWALGKPHPSAALARAWDLLLQNQSHDSVGCSSADGVYRDIMNRYERAEDIARELIDESLQWLARLAARQPAAGAEGATLLLFNPLSWERSGRVTSEIDIPEARGIEHPVFHVDGVGLPSSIESRRRTLLVRYNPQHGHPSRIPVQRCRVSLDIGTMPALGYRTAALGSGAAPSGEEGLAVGPDTLENESLRVTVGAHGALEVLHKGSGCLFSNLNVFEDGGENGSGYDYIPPAADRLVRSDASLANVRIVLNSPLKATLQVDVVMPLPVALTADRTARREETVDCRITSLVTLTRGCPRVDIETTLDNRARDHRLRVLFASGLEGAAQACAEQPFDVVARPIARPAEPPRPGAPIIGTRPQQSFVDVSDGQRGLMVANQGIYEYEVSDESSRTLALTLLRCTDRIDPGAFAEALDFAIPLGQSQGEHRFHYSLIPHRGEWREACRHAWEFKQPVLAVLQRDPEDSLLPGYRPPPGAGTLPASHAFVQVEPDPLVVCSLKKHQVRDSLVLRLWNPADVAVNGSVRLSIPGRRASGAWATNLNEEREEALTLDAGGAVAVALRPRGLFTVEFELG